MTARIRLQSASDVSRIEAAARDHHFQLLQPFDRCFAADKAGATPDLSDDGIERVVDVVRRALIAQHHQRFAADMFAHRRQDARFADAGLARQRHDLALPGLCQPPTVHQDSHFVLAADKGGHGFGARRLESRDALDFPQHRPGRYRRFEALELMQSEALQLESPAQEPSCRLGDDDRVGLGEGLQPGRQVRRVSDDAAFTGITFADQLADDDEAGGDADSQPQVDSALAAELTHRRQQRDRGPHCAFGVIFMGARITEIDRCAVAKPSRDVAVEAYDRGRYRALERTHQVGHIFRLKLRRQRRRIDEIAEHDGQLAPVCGIL